MDASAMALWLIQRGASELSTAGILQICNAVECTVMSRVSRH